MKRIFKSYFTSDNNYLHIHRRTRYCKIREFLMNIECCRLGSLEDSENVYIHEVNTIHLEIQWRGGRASLSSNGEPPFIHETSLYTRKVFLERKARTSTLPLWQKRLKKAKSRGGLWSQSEPRPLSEQENLKTCRCLVFNDKKIEPPLAKDAFDLWV